MRLFPLLPLALALAALGAPTGCRTAPAPVNHVVLVKLADPADAGAVVAASDRLIRPIPSVRSYACGRHYDIGRASVDADYDVALVVTFEDRAGYEAYLEHPDHVAFVEAWKPRLHWLRIHDFLAEDASGATAR